MFICYEDEYLYDSKRDIMCLHNYIAKKAYIVIYYDYTTYIDSNSKFKQFIIKAFDKDGNKRIVKYEYLDCDDQFTSRFINYLNDVITKTLSGIFECPYVIPHIDVNFNKSFDYATFVEIEKADIGIEYDKTIKVSKKKTDNNTNKNRYNIYHKEHVKPIHNTVVSNTNKIKYNSVPQDTYICSSSIGSIMDAYNEYKLSYEY